MSTLRTPPSKGGRRIVICDYNRLLQSVTRLRRMSRYTVFQAYDGLAAEELCLELPDIQLLVLNALGTGIDIGDLIQAVRRRRSELPVLHIGNSVQDSLPPDIPTLAEDFTACCAWEVGHPLDASTPRANGPPVEASPLCCLVLSAAPACAA